MTDTSDFASLVGTALATALDRKGYTTLTPVQLAVLDEKLVGRDLRITSQTGSGKTVAIGLSLREMVTPDPSAERSKSKPRVLVIAPTRELAKQVEEELGWLYASLGARVVSVTGGASYMQERRALGAGPAVVVGTPGRLLDHLRKGGVDASALGAVVIDEADRMLDLGFRDDLEAILGFAPPEHVTHLVSATFPREVKALADKVQREPAFVEGTPLGTANADIEHLVHLVDSRNRVDAIVNLLLATPDAQTLVFARTRADVARITRELAEAGFHVSSLSGEMDQPERTRALAAFKRGNLHALIATDVAARGIDVQDIARVIHAEPPDDADAYTHRSGRTGRAGKKGMSSVLVSPSSLSKTTRLLGRARVKFRFEPIPSAEQIRAAADERLVADLTGEIENETIDARAQALASRLAHGGHATRSLARLLARIRQNGPNEPRDIRLIAPPAPERAPYPRAAANTRPQSHGRDHDRAPSRSREHAPARTHNPAPTREHAPSRDHAPTREHAPSRDHAPTRDHDRGPARDHDRGPSRSPRPPREPQSGWVPFRVSWGQEAGADARRLLALVCRRGGVRGSDVGAIHVARRHAVVEIAGTVADAFGRAAAAPDPRDPRISIRPEQPQPPERTHALERTHGPRGGDAHPKRRSSH